MTSIQSLTAHLVRRKQPLLVAPPAAIPGAFEIDYEVQPAASATAPSRLFGGEDLRFFLTCYAVGLVFFLVMLS